jgi:hypothetical protein
MEVNMNTRVNLHAVLLTVCVAVFGLGCQSAFARGFGGGHGFGVHGGAFYGRAFGGYRPVYGFRGGYYGGVGALGLGLYVASLPFYYSTYWWDGAPYYYADNVYYRYNDTARLYEKVTPPAGLKQQATAPTAGSTELFVYPKNGQTDQQQASDKIECKRWASNQYGLDTAASTDTLPEAAKSAEFMRAQTACLEGRGYSVR